MTDIPRAAVRFDIVALDTDDPPRLADFYCALLGWRVQKVEADWITIVGPDESGEAGAPRMAFQLAPDHRPPTWPDDEVPQQLHLDLAVDDLPAASAFAESLGARRVTGAEVQPGFVVFLDPSGHPFCLCD